MKKQILDATNSIVSEVELIYKSVNKEKIKITSSGMSRTMKFTSCEFNAKDKRASYYNYYCLFIALGYSEARAKNYYFSISGCGMDMVFNTNYNIIHNLKRLGFITDEECRKLAQMTPTVL